MKNGNEAMTNYAVGIQQRAAVSGEEVITEGLPDYSGKQVSTK
jgi:hypothetical protein